MWRRARSVSGGGRACHPLAASLSLPSTRTYPRSNHPFFLPSSSAESLRLYPQPPILIRRALTPDTLPPGLNGDPNGYPIGKGADLFISVWNLHHSPHLWREPEAFRPERFFEHNDNPAFNGKWAGYNPEAQGSSLYPNEVSSDFAFIPFGGGARKCIGDQFALFEATVAMAMLLRRFTFKLAVPAKEVGAASALYCWLYEYMIQACNIYNVNLLRSYIQYAGWNGDRGYDSHCERDAHEDGEAEGCSCCILVRSHSSRGCGIGSIPLLSLIARFLSHPLRSLPPPRDGHRSPPIIGLPVFMILTLVLSSVRGASSGLPPPPSPALLAPLP